MCICIIVHILPSSGTAGRRGRRRRQYRLAFSAALAADSGLIAVAGVDGRFTATRRPGARAIY